MRGSPGGPAGTFDCDPEFFEKLPPYAEDALIVEGKFTALDPGSRAKRYLVGFGAGDQHPCPRS